MLISRASKDKITFMNNAKNQIKGFTIKELIVVIILIILFYFGFMKGEGLVSQWKNQFGGILPLVCGILTGSLFVSCFILLSLGIGYFLEKRRCLDHKNEQQQKKQV